MKPTKADNKCEVSHGLRVGSKVWIAAVWDSRKRPKEVTITRIWKGQRDRDRHFHFQPPAFGNSFFGWNGKCFGGYHWAYRTREEALNHEGR